jgi:two-component system LytT family response regulator
MKVNCIIIDDEQLARKGMTNFIKEVSFLNLVGVFANPIEALPLVSDKGVDLIFLDIQMPKMSGMEFLKTLPQPPLTIITSAFPNHALESFELNVIDYLIKPVPLERFIKAVNKAKEYIELQIKVASGNNEPEDYFFIKCASRFEKIMFSDLLYVEAMQNYVVLHTKTRRFVSYLTFKTVGQYLPEKLFIKVHKSYIVAISKIDSIDGTDIKIGPHTVTISRANKDEVLKSIMKNKLLHR